MKEKQPTCTGGFVVLWQQCWLNTVQLYDLQLTASKTHCHNHLPIFRKHLLQIPYCRAPLSTLYTRRLFRPESLPCSRPPTRKMHEHKNLVQGLDSQPIYGDCRVSKM